MHQSRQVMRIVIGSMVVIILLFGGGASSSRSDTHNSCFVSVTTSPSQVIFPEVEDQNEYTFSIRGDLQKKSKTGFTIIDLLKSLIIFWER